MDKSTAVTLFPKNPYKMNFVPRILQFGKQIIKTTEFSVKRRLLGKNEFCDHLQRPKNWFLVILRWFLKYIFKKTFEIHKLNIRIFNII